MNYKEATQEWQRVSVSHAKGEALIAMTCLTLSQAHPGINPEKLYDGAIKEKVSYKRLVKMTGMELSDLMFKGMGI